MGWIIMRGNGLKRHLNRFFWLALYAQPALWVCLAITAIVWFEFKWLSLIGTYPISSGRCHYERLEQDHRDHVDWRWKTSTFRKPWLTFWSDTAIALALTITNTLAFSRCDKFSQASTLASSAMYSGGLARSVAGGLFSRLFNR